MTQLHLMTVMGTRPEIIRLSEIIRCCDRYFRQTLVHTGQNWDEALHQVFFRDLELRPPDVQLHVAGAHLGADPGEHPGPVLCTDAGAPAGCPADSGGYQLLPLSHFRPSLADTYFPSGGGKPLL